MDVLSEIPNEKRDTSPVVSTIDAKCKRCYSCIRQCPAKAIKVVNGQAQVIAERCIACGNCIKVCPQHAKRIRDGIEHTRQLLKSPNTVLAILAPSFPAAFEHVKPGQVINGLRQLGFDQVAEVAFGADMITDDYNEILESGVMPTVITSPCPAIVTYIEKYYPHLTMVLAPIVSPMIAMGRVIKEKYCPDARVVFVGPCIAKKKEIEEPEVADTIDEVLTFDELETMFNQDAVDLSAASDDDFDGPRAGLGRVFPISGGLITCSDCQEDILDNDILVSEGRERILEVLSKVEAGDIDARFVDVLFCRGCIKGPMMANDESVFVRKDRVVNYIKSHDDKERQKQAERDHQRYKSIDFHRGFHIEEMTARQPSEQEVQEILKKTGKYHPEDELNCGACGYATCREKAIAVYQGLAEAEMCLPYMLEKLEKTQHKLSKSNKKLRKSIQSLRQTQQQLLQSEKLASVGKLAAGVAHELNNPLGGILLYTNMLLKKLQDSPDEKALNKVVNEAERCRHIVQGLLDFSRQRPVERKPADLNQILETTLKLLIDQAIFQNIRITKKLATGLTPVSVDRMQMQQVFLNILLNAAEAMEGRGELQLITENTPSGEQIFATIKDNGPGMNKVTQQRIFDPFYTTKPVGQGTGLGMAIVYGILQKHGGDIKVMSESGKGSTFTVVLPVDGRQSASSK